MANIANMNQQFVMNSATEVKDNLVLNNLADPVYLDYNATTPCDPRVVEAMLPYFTQIFGNPANGLHPQGRQAARAVTIAREQVAALIAAQPHEIFFTAGATESNNLALFGLARGFGRSQRRRIVISAVEHKAVLSPCERLQAEGFELVILPVDAQGCVDVAAAMEFINDQTLLVSVQMANNETGTIQPIATLADLAHMRGALFHCDAAQAAGKIGVNVDDAGIDFLSASAHKLYGPKGIGLLYVRGGTQTFGLQPQMLGGGQESGLRGGTSNVPAIVGFGEACRICHELGSDEGVRIETLRNCLEEGLLSAVAPLKIQSQSAARLPNTSSLTFPGVDADALLLNLPNVMMGTGSACNSGAIEPSHVLQAMGVSRADAFSTIRATLGRFTTTGEIMFAIHEITSAWQTVK
jgi:cysteine desulfurase